MDKNGRPEDEKQTTPEAFDETACNTEPAEAFVDASTEDSDGDRLYDTRYRYDDDPEDGEEPTELTLGQLLKIAGIAAAVIGGITLAISLVAFRHSDD